MQGNDPNIDKALELEWKSTDSRKNETIKLKCVTEENEAAQLAIEEVIEQTQGHFILDSSNSSSITF